MTEPSLWQRVKRARIVQVLAVYLGASWAILQIAEVLTGALSLPDWVLPVAIILLLVGLVVILSTAWIQSMPSTTAAERAGKLPSDWQIAPKEALSSLRQGRLPHLTWGRALLGGVVALSLLFGGTGLYVGFNGRSLGLGPTEAGAAEAPEGIAVVPFDVRGADLEIWREGMMDLLTNNLDGVGGFRTIDSRTVMARWQDQVGDARTADLTSALRVAASTGARYALEGSVVGLGPNVRLVANVYDLSTREEVAQGQAEGPAEDVLRLVDELAVGTMRSLLTSIGRAGSGDLNAETLTTSSLPALRAFLEGEAHYRRGRFAEAVQSFEKAVAEDTAFAIALVRLSESYGWLEDATSERLQEYGKRAEAHADRLSPRYQFIMEGWSALNRGTADGVAPLKEAVQKYPDDPEAWFLLAETYLHIGGASYGTREETWEALEKAIGLDPNFAPYLVHKAEFAVLRGDRVLAEETLARYERLAGHRTGLEGIELAIPLLLGDSAEAAAAVESARTASERTLAIYNGTFGQRHDRFDREEAVVVLLNENARDAFHSYYAGSMGELERGARTAALPTVTPSSRGIYWGHVAELWDVAPPTDDTPGGIIDARSCDQPAFNPTCHLILGTAMARWGRWAEHERSIARFREDAARVREEDSDLADRREAWAEVLEGFGLVRRGDARRGRELLERHTGRAGAAGERARLELGRLDAEAGRHGQALRHYRSVLDGYARPLALYGAATMHERLGQDDEAGRYWRSLATLTRTGDPLPRIVEAREKAGG